MGEGQIVNVNIDDQDRMMWNEIASDLLVSLGDPEADYEQTVGGVARYLERMVEWLLRVIMRDGKVEECDVSIGREGMGARCIGDTGKTGITAR